MGDGQSIGRSIPLFLQVSRTTQVFTGDVNEVLTAHYTYESTAHEAKIR